MTPSSLPAGYNGALYPLVATAAAGFTGTVRSGVVSVTNANPAGAFAISISSANGCGEATTSFSLGVGTAANVIATATTSTACWPLAPSRDSPISRHWACRSSGSTIIAKSHVDDLRNGVK